MINFEELLIQLLPDSFQSDKNKSQDLLNLLTVFGKEFNIINAAIGSIHDQLHPLLCDEEFLTIISKNLNRPIDSRLPVDANRRTLFTAVETFKIKGTVQSLNNLLFDLSLVGEPRQLYTDDYDPGNFVDEDDIPGGSPAYYKTSHFRIDIIPSADIANTEDSILIFLDNVSQIIPINIVVSVNVLAGGGTEPMNVAMIANYVPIICGDFTLVTNDGNKPFVYEDN